MKDLYSILYNLRNSDRVVYEIVSNDEEIKYKKLINNISNMDIDPRIKKFFIDQIEFKTGSYTYKDLYKLVNEYIIKIKNDNNCPYHNLYPIIIDDKTYINNIALFIACLKLNLKPVCIEYDYIPQIEDKPGIIKDYSFGICSSGSVKKKIVSLYEEKAINNSDTFITNVHSVSYCTNTITGIVGISSIILEPLVVHSKVIINNKNNFFDEISKRKNITHVMLPVDFKKYYYDRIWGLSLKIGRLLDNPRKMKFILGGSYFSIDDINNLMMALNENDLNNIILVYGRTENYGMVSKCNLGSCRYISINLLDINWKKKEPCLIKKKMIDNIFSKRKSCIFIKNDINNLSIINFLSVGKINPKRIKILSRPFGEILVDGLNTGDIGYIDRDNYLYLIYRKNNYDSLLIEYLQSRGLTCSVDFLENGKKKLVIDCAKEDKFDFSMISKFNEYINLKEFRLIIENFGFAIDDVEVRKISKTFNLKKNPIFINNSERTKNYSKFFSNISSLQEYVLWYLIQRKGINLSIKEMFSFWEFCECDFFGELDRKFNIDQLVFFLLFDKVDVIVDRIVNDLNIDFSLFKFDIFEKLKTIDLDYSMIKYINNFLLNFENRDGEVIQIYDLEDRKIIADILYTLIYSIGPYSCWKNLSPKDKLIVNNMMENEINDIVNKIEEMIKNEYKFKSI